MTHMAFSIFYDLQIHGFGVTFATLKKRNVSCDSECPQALPGTNHSIQKKNGPCWLRALWAAARASHTAVAQN
jgi:hypothetical protein